ncbi:MAG: acetyl-CoA carboxylase biotin carboxyl carrier protein [Elusimicrobia bacterium]|nr:acetyl-CoA carboxylase biotin carboxyl carrier protein [Elusimicrobiota bacterium]
MKMSEGLKRIKELLDAIEGTDIEEISCEKGGLNIGIRKKSGISAVMSAVRDGKEEQPVAEEPVQTETVVSHSVGLFRDSMPPSRKALVKAGQKVSKGDKLGAIESMKILKEIISPVDGKVVKKYVKNGSPVEYGQKLFDIEIV